MAAVTMVVSESVNCFGIAPTDLWGAYNWGAFIWGEGTAKIATQDTMIVRESTTESDAMGVTASPLVSESIAPTTDNTSEMLQEDVWFKVFTGPTTEAEDRNITTWS